MPYSSKESLDWVNKRWKEDAPCEACGKSDWGVSEGIALKVIATGNDVLSYAERTLPVVPVICKYCGNIRFLHEAIIGAGEVES